MSFTEAANDNTSGIDISFDELGFDHEDMENLRVLGFSANTRNEETGEPENEVVLATAEYPQTLGVQGHVYVAVKSATDEYSELPYTLQIETSRPFDVVALDHQDPAPQPLVGPGEAKDWNLPEPQGPKTLFVTQLDRMDALYAADGGGQRVKDALLRVAESVEGKILSVPASLYDSWDREPGLVEEANKVAQEIRALLQTELATYQSIEYVVLVGNDRIIPFRRLIDQTLIGNEQTYADESFLVPLSATLSSIANGYILTDDYYVDEAAIGWNGSFLYVPDLAISRLVETPDEIDSTIAAFEDAGGELAPTVGVVSGYDFMADGAERVGDILGPQTVSLISRPEDDPWTGNQLWAALGSGAEVGSLNAHFTHFAGLSDYGYRQYEDGEAYDIGELLLGTEIADAGNGNAFRNKLLFSMGCHAGLNIPDEQAVLWAPEDSTNPALDLPQAMMRQGGVYIGSTGYGYGDTVGMAGTEALIVFLAEKLAAGGGTVGQALADAKQEYLGSLSTLTPYDQKSSVQFVLYGMPQYALPTEFSAPTVAAASASLAAATWTGDLDPFRLRVTESSMDPTDNRTSTIPDQSYELTLEGELHDQYIAANGNAEATADRPIHPIVTVDLPDGLNQGPAHGFVYKRGSYTNLPDFEPAISRITNEWEISDAEFQSATSQFWPVQPGMLNTIETSAAPGGHAQTFVAVPAQFKPEGTNDYGIFGTERVWSALDSSSPSLDVEVLRSESSDWLPPSVYDVEMWIAENQLTVSVNAEDGDTGNGISRIVVLQFDESGMYTPEGGDQEFNNGMPNANGRYELTLTYGTAPRPGDISLFIQVVDGAGNVTTLTGRGATVRWPFGDGWGLQNPGFETGSLPPYWTKSEPIAGNVAVLGQDNLVTLGTDKPVLVEPSTFSPEQMLRLGIPKDKNAHQEKGITSVSQTFVSDGLPIVVAYRVISLDHRSLEDIFVIDVKDAYGNLVLAPITIPNVVSDPYGDSGWQDEIITGLPAGRSFTITYTLNNTQSASHNTWVYADQGPASPDN